MIQPVDTLRPGGRLAGGRFGRSIRKEAEKDAADLLSIVGGLDEGDERMIFHELGTCFCPYLLENHIGGF